uniref:Kelch domain-containing protein 10 n=1 Tax=Heterorhabditis bacteriophora TaxID=37862 RepID=A0A1I7WMI3_HETBA
MAVEFFRGFPALHKLFSSHCDPNDVTFPRTEMNLMQFQKMRIGDGEHKEEEQPINMDLFALGNLMDSYGFLYLVTMSLATPILARAHRNRVRQPGARSGHRVFIDEDFLYIMGGYDRTEDIARIYRDVWRYNLMTRNWQKMTVSGEFPSALASFTLCQMSPFSRDFVVFGGTSVPFGDTTSGEVYMLTIDDTQNSITSILLQVEGDKRPTYGHAMVRGPDPCSFYIIGGTTGHEFFLDVDRLHLSQGKWSWTASGRGNREGRYRLETILDGNLIYFFGGGKPDHLDSLRELIVFDLKANTYKQLQTLPDKELTESLGEDHGFPKERSESRTNEGQYCWLAPPSLRTFAAITLRHSVDKERYMSLSLLTYNTCGYGGCGLHFANQYDLIAHIEFTHIQYSILLTDLHHVVQKSLKYRSIIIENGIISVNFFKTWIYFLYMRDAHIIREHYFNTINYGYVPKSHSKKSDPETRFRCQLPDLHVLIDASSVQRNIRPLRDSQIMSYKLTRSNQASLKAPLPVRSLPAPQARYSQHQISQQTTGQMLQQQIQQRRKEAQMVVQQAHLQVSQSQTLQSGRFIIS